MPGYAVFDLAALAFLLPLLAWDLATLKRVHPATLYGAPDAVRAQARVVLDSYRDGNGGSREGHVFNLGHGMSPDMDPEHVAALVDEVHAYSAR